MSVDMAMWEMIGNDFNRRCDNRELGRGGKRNERRRKERS
jgi:hypothetical protein